MIQKKWTGLDLARKMTLLSKFWLLWLIEDHIEAVDATVVYWLAHLPSKQRVWTWYKKPQLTAKAVHRHPCQTSTPCAFLFFWFHLKLNQLNLCGRWLFHFCLNLIRNFTFLQIFGLFGSIKMLGSVCWWYQITVAA